MARIGSNPPPLQETSSNRAEEERSAVFKGHSVVKTRMKNVFQVDISEWTKRALKVVAFLTLGTAFAFKGYSKLWKDVFTGRDIQVHSHDPSVVVAKIFGVTYEKLFSKDALNHIGSNGWTPMTQELLDGNDDRVSALIEAGADPYAFNSDGTTAITAAAAAGGRVCAVELLIDAQVDISRRDRNGDNVLTAAVTHGQTAVVELLRKKNVNLLQLDDPKHPVIIDAVKHGDLVTVLALKQAGVQLDVKDEHGLTLQDLAQKIEDRRLIPSLLEVLS